MTDTEHLLSLADTLKDEFGDGVEDIFEFRDEVTVVVGRDALIDVLAYCRDADGFEFNLLSDLAGNDYWPDEPRFGVSYVLYSLPLNQQLRIKVYVPGNDANLPTATGVWQGAEWPEREIWDMFGVTFTDHPDLRRILMPYDWTGHPQRKDYPLGYEEVQFSFNVDRIEAKKPRPKS